MQQVIDKLNAIIDRFEGAQPLGYRWHTATREDFIDLTQAVKRLAEELQKSGEEID